MTLILLLPAPVHAQTDRGTVAGPASILDCRIVAQSPTEVTLQGHFDWPAIVSAAKSDRLLPVLGYIAIPQGARASLAAVAGGPGSATEGALSLSPPQRLRGIEVVGLRIDLAAAAAPGLTARTEDVEIRVSFSGGTGRFGEPRLRHGLWAPVIERLVLNHASLPPAAPAPLCSRDDAWEYIIICPDDEAFTAWADSLKTWRTLQGITTQVFTTAEIGSTWQEIRDFLVNAYTTWTVPPSAFLLLGDYPGSGDGRPGGIPAPIYNSYAVSDNLYADIDGDGLPDMFHGRITARSGAELAQMIGKLLAHERTPSLDPAFYAHPVLAGGWEPDGRSVMELETLYGFHADVLGKEPVREYVAIDPGSQWPDPEWVIAFGPQGLGYLPATPGHLSDWGGSAERINADINSGAFMVIHRGAGSVTSWGDPLYTVGDVAGLDNTDYPFVFSIDCLTGKFNSAGACLTEALHRTADGALGMISATEVGYSLPTSRLMLYLLNAMWPDFLNPGGGGAPELRPACALSIAKYALSMDVLPISPQQKQVTYHLFHHHGDPFLVMNSEVPQPLSVEHAGSCTMGATTFTVRAQAGAWIGLTIDGVLVGAGPGTGASVPIPITAPTRPGTLRITVTRQNHLRYDVRVPILDASDVGPPWASLPEELRLDLAGRNPLSRAAHLRYAIPSGLAGARATLSVHDAAGRRVRTLTDGPRAAGVHDVRWDGADDAGSPVGAGIYFARLACGEQTVTRRIARVE